MERYLLESYFTAWILENARSDAICRLHSYFWRPLEFLVPGTGAFEWAMFVALFVGSAFEA
jgi:hypothetical protein